MTERVPNEWERAEAIVVGMLSMIRPLRWPDAKRMTGGHDPTTTLRMLVAESVLLRHDREGYGAWTSSWSFTREGRLIAEATELRLFAAGVVELPDRSDRRTA